MLLCTKITFILSYLIFKVSVNQKENSLMRKLIRPGHKATDSRISFASIYNFTIATANFPIHIISYRIIPNIIVYHSVLISWIHPNLLGIFICQLSRWPLLKLYYLTDINNVSFYRVLTNKHEYKKILHSQGLWISP